MRAQPRKQPPAAARFAFLGPHLKRIAALWALTLVAYSNCFSSGFIFDNQAVIAEDVRMREATLDNVHLILTQGYWYMRGEGRLYRPLTTLSYWWNYAVMGGGLNPVGYHAVNLLLHLANILLVYVLGLVLLEEIPLACAAAALWAVHPLLTESVTNIVGRADLLATFGILAGLLCHIRAASAMGRRRNVWVAGIAGAATVAIFSKESGIVLLAAMVFHDAAFRGRASWRARLAGYAAACAPVAIYLAVRARVIAGIAAGGVAFTDNPLVGASFWPAHLTALKVLVRYLGLMVWPARLSCDYSFNQIPVTGWSDPEVWFALGVCAVLAGAWWFGWRRARPVFFLLSVAVAAVAPSANLIFPAGTIMAERFLYLPAAMMAGCAILAWRWGARRWKWLESIGPVLLGIVCLVFAARTWARNADWAGPVALWSSAVESAPNSYKTHTNLALSLGVDGEQQASGQREAERAAAILSALPDMQSTAGPFAELGRRYRIQGDATSGPAERAAWYGKALAALERGRQIDRTQTVSVGHEAISGPVSAELGRVYRRLGRTDEALQILQFGLPSQSADVCEELGDVLVGRGELERAAVSYFEAFSLNAYRTSVAAKVMDVYRRLDPGGSSLSASGLNLASPLVHKDVCESARNVIHRYLERHSPVPAGAVRSQAMSGLGCSAAELE